MILEARYNCTHFGGDPNNPIYRIGDRVVIDSSSLTQRLKIGKKNKAMNLVYINGLLFDLSAFEIIDTSQLRDEKIDIIIN